MSDPWLRREVIGNATLYLGDVLAVLSALPDASVHCCVTSPPYWGLRDYGTEPQVWGGNADCSHDWDGFMRAGMSGGPSDKQDSNAGSKVKQQQQQCNKCAAWRGNFGLEPTPEMYVAHMVEIFREVRRVLRDDGTLWLNLGDSYSGSGKGGNPDPGSSKQATNAGSQTIGVLYGKTADTAREAALTNVSRRWTTEQGIPPKNLIGIPWRVAFALQDDGWYLRQDIIWAKPNPMPESVRDRCTKAHEYIFLLSKSERYYFDADAIAEQSITGDPRKPYAPGQVDARGDGHDRNGGAVRESVKRGGFIAKPGTPEGREPFRAIQDTRNKRSVWTVATHPYAEAHFATFPPKLIEPCVLAGCPVDGTLLDPFAGSGTSGEVALLLSRKFVGIELSETYFDSLLTKRITNAQRQERMFV